MGATPTGPPPAKGEWVGDGIMTYIHHETKEEPPHECVPPDQTRQFIPTGSVWWCLKCDYEWVLERKGGWKKWRRRP